MIDLEHLHIKSNLGPSLFFLRYCTLKSPAIWLAKNILTHKLRTRLSTGKGFPVKHKWQCFILDYLQKKLNIFFFQKNPLFLTNCVPFWAKQNVRLNSISIIFLRKIPTNTANSGSRGTHAYMHGTGILWNTSNFISFGLWNKLLKC